jgi:trigger factor
MNVVVESLPNCLATLRVEVEPEKVVEAKNRVTKEFGDAVRIPGYRPGKAPKGIIEKKYKKQIREEMEKQLLGDSTRRAIAEKNLRVLQVADIEDVEFGADDRLSFTATVITQPEFTLPEYKGLTVTVAATDVTEEEVDESIANLREQASDFEDVAEDRGAQMEDFIVVDYEGTIEGKAVHELFPKAGRPLSGNVDFWIKMTEEAFFPGYCEALVGARPNETRNFEITVPDDFPVPGMPGQKIHYEVTVKAIKKKTLPELDDAFAATVVKGKTLADLRAMAREELERQKKTDLEVEKRNQLMKQLLSRVECELPTNLVRQETQRILSDIVRENEARGVTADVLKESEKELVGAAAQNAREKLKGTFVLLRVAEKEGLRVTKEELNGRIATMAQKYGMTFEKMVKELEQRNAVNQIHEEFLTGKALEFLVANAHVVRSGQ